MGAQAFSDLLVSTQGHIGTLNDTVEVSEMLIKTLTAKLQGSGSEDKEAEKELMDYQRELTSTRTAIGELKEFYREISRHWSKAKNRVIGYVAWAPPISYMTPPHGHTVDVCVIKLDKEKFLENFKGNVLDLGTCQSVSLKVSKLTVHIPGPEINKTRFTQLMYSRTDLPRSFKYPVGRLLKLNGILSAEEIRKANDKERNDKPLVIKRGPITHTTIGRLSGLKSRTRRYFTPGTADSLEVAVYPYSNEISPFSKPGDSGSIIVDAGGKFVTLLTAGAGLIDTSDVTYGSPICWLWELIKPRFPGANLYFENNNI
jgi:hypothetical protein